jgi:hypothetical protein
VEGTYVVYAIGQRLIGKETEYYRWAVSSRDVSEPANLLLHNANLDDL